MLPVTWCRKDLMRLLSKLYLLQSENIDQIFDELFVEDMMLFHEEETKRLFKIIASDIDEMFKNLANDFK